MKLDFFICYSIHDERSVTLTFTHLGSLSWRFLSIGLSAWDTWTTRNCFKPSASLTVVLWFCGQGSWRLAGLWKRVVRRYNVTRGTRYIRFEASLNYVNTWQDMVKLTN